MSRNELNNTAHKWAKVLKKSGVTIAKTDFLGLGGIFCFG